MPLEEVAASWLPVQLRRGGVAEGASVHFVTHSMGGILLRLYRREHPEARIGRAVMIAPPNAGSEIVEHLARFPPLHWIWSRNGVRLGTGPDALPQRLGPWPAGADALGILAGDRSFNPLFSSWIGAPNDGKVAVARTRLEGMSDFLVLPHSHTWLQWRGDAVAQVTAFLRDGRFQRPDRR